MKIHAVFNRDSGTFRTMDMEDYCRRATRDILRARQRLLLRRRFRRGGPCEALEKASRRSDLDAILAGGGDGTISTAAGICWREGHAARRRARRHDEPFRPLGASAARPLRGARRSRRRPDQERRHRDRQRPRLCASVFGGPARAHGAAAQLLPLPLALGKDARQRARRAPGHAGSAGLRGGLPDRRQGGAAAHLGDLRSPTTISAPTRCSTPRR